MENLLLIAGGGLFAGFLAGLFGIGGGVVLVPLITALGYSPLQAVATSSFAIILTATSGTLQNYRMGYVDLKRILSLGVSAILTAQLGVYVANLISDYLLLFGFGFLLLLNIALASWRRNLNQTEKSFQDQTGTQKTIARIITGGSAGFLAGLFGIGGGVIIVPLQMVLLGETIKVAIQTSLGVVLITSVSSTLGHATQGNVLITEGFLLGLGGLVGAQISTRYLPKIGDRAVTFAFYILMAVFAFYSFWQAFTIIDY